MSFKAGQSCICFYYKINYCCLHKLHVILFNILLVQLPIKHANPSIEVTSENSTLHACDDNTIYVPKKASPTKARPRSGSWGGAYESEEDIHVRKSLLIQTNKLALKSSL